MCNFVLGNFFDISPATVPELPESDFFFFFFYCYLQSRRPPRNETHCFNF